MEEEEGKNSFGIPRMSRIFFLRTRCSGVNILPEGLLKEGLAGDAGGACISYNGMNLQSLEDSSFYEVLMSSYLV